MYSAYRESRAMDSRRAWKAAGTGIVTMVCRKWPGLSHASLPSTR